MALTIRHLLTFRQFEDHLEWMPPFTPVVYNKNETKLADVERREKNNTSRGLPSGVNKSMTPPEMA